MLRIRRIERALELRQRRIVSPLDPECSGGVAQPTNGVLVRLGHHPEQPRLRREESLTHREVRGERQCRVPRLGPQTRAELDVVAPVLGPVDDLLRRVDSRRAACLVRSRHPASELLELGREVLRGDLGVRELRSAADHRRLHVVEVRTPGLVEADDEDRRRSVAVGQEARRAFGEDGRVQAGAPVGR
jgi:hypothetical protein